MPYNKSPSLRTILMNLSAFVLARAQTQSAVLIGTAVLGNILRILNTIILTRLLAPGDFGLVGIISSIFFVVAMLTDAGFQAFIIRHERGLDPEFLDSVWTIHVARGVSNAMLIALLALPLSYLVGKPEVARLLAVASICFLIDGLASTSLMTSLRERLVRRLSLVELAISLVQLVVGAVTAYFIMSVWALIVTMITASGLRTIASFILFPSAQRRARFSRPVAIELWQFSRLITVSSALTLLITQFDKLILARLLTLGDFGAYAIGANLAAAPAAVVYLYVARIMYPAFSEGWRAQAASAGSLFYEVRGIVFYGYLFSSCVLIFAAPLVVRILYDPRYLFAGEYLGWLAIATAMFMLTKPINEFLVAIGQTATTLRMNVIRVVWLFLVGPPSFILLGPVGLIATVGLVELPAYLYGLWAMSRFKYLNPLRETVAFVPMLAGMLVGFAINHFAPNLEVYTRL